MKIIKQDMEIHIYSSGTWYMDWLKNSKRHREDGPATMWNDQVEFYYLKGELYFQNKEYYWKKVHENY